MNPPASASARPSGASRSNSTSSIKTCHFPSDPAALTIVPPLTTSHIPTPPLTPLTPLTSCLKTPNKTPSTYLPTPPTPISPTSSNRLHIPSPPAPPIPIAHSLPDGSDGHHNLHAPLVTHLTLLHPSTPKEVIHFCATRLLSPDLPYGFDEDTDGNKDGEKERQWEPLWKGVGDLATAGLGLEAAKGTEQTGPGKKEDQRLEWMYRVARRSWGLLEMKAPAEGDRM